VELDLDERVLSALRQLGFSKRDATWAVSAVRDEEMKHDVGAILRAAVHVLTASSLR
jgi:Holliday junction resolvasome RuvABC DNA-binding subunit